MRYHLWIKLLVVFSVSCGGTHNLLLEKRARSEVQNIKIESALRNKKTGILTILRKGILRENSPLELKTNKRRIHEKLKIGIIMRLYLYFQK
jgi:hypothetical protein